LIKKHATTVEIVDIPSEFDEAVAVAWKRVQRLSWGMPLFMLEAVKPMLVSIYMQGIVDGYSVREKEQVRAAAQTKAESG
jgi:hypothetical protein